MKLIEHLYTKIIVMDTSISFEKWRVSQLGNWELLLLLL